MHRPPLARSAALLVVVVGVLGACDGGGSGWGVETVPTSTPTTVLLGPGEEDATIRGPDGVELRVSLYFINQPPVPVSLESEESVYIQIHLAVANTGTVPFSGVLADAADLDVVPSGTLAPVPAETVPSEIALSRGVDFSEPVTIAPGGPEVQGKVVFQIEPDDSVAAFSLTLPGGTETVRWHF